VGNTLNKNIKTKIRKIRNQKNKNNYRITRTAKYLRIKLYKGDKKF